MFNAAELNNTCGTCVKKFIVELLLLLFVLCYVIVGYFITFYLSEFMTLCKASYAFRLVIIEERCFLL